MIPTTHCPLMFSCPSSHLPFHPISSSFICCYTTGCWLSILLKYLLHIAIFCGGESALFIFHIRTLPPGLESVPDELACEGRSKHHQHKELEQSLSSYGEPGWAVRIPLTPSYQLAQVADYSILEWARPFIWGIGGVGEVAIGKIILFRLRENQQDMKTQKVCVYVCMCVYLCARVCLCVAADYLTVIVWKGEPSFLNEEMTSSFLPIRGYD